METRKPGIRIGGVLGILAIVLILFFAGIFLIVRETTNAILSPVREANSELKTQVSEFLHPTPTILPDPITIIHEVRSLARLETIQYSVEKVITAEVGQGQLSFLFGDRLLFVAHGVVIAGVDLNKMTSTDVWLEGETLYIKTPDPEVFIATLDNDKSYVFDRETGILTKGYTALETQARIVAENEILKAAMEDGILDLARQNANAYLERLLKGLGYQVIIFIEATPTP